MKNIDFLQPEYDFNPVVFSELNHNLVVTDELINQFDELFSDGRMRTREGIQEFSDYVERLDDSLGEDPFTLFHTFGAGTYTREIHMPKGYVVIGQ